MEAAPAPDAGGGSGTKEATPKKTRLVALTPSSRPLQGASEFDVNSRRAIHKTATLPPVLRRRAKASLVRRWCFSRLATQDWCWEKQKWKPRNEHRLQRIGFPRGLLECTVEVQWKTQRWEKKQRLELLVKSGDDELNTVETSKRGFEGIGITAHCRSL